jgi:hypothetical protein
MLAPAHEHVKLRLKTPGTPMYIGRAKERVFLTELTRQVDQVEVHSLDYKLASVVRCHKNFFKHEVDQIVSTI